MGWTSVGNPDLLSTGIVILGYALKVLDLVTHFPHLEGGKVIKLLSQSC